MPTTFKFCLPTSAASVPDRPNWLHEVKYDGLYEGHAVKKFFAISISSLPTFQEGSGERSSAGTVRIMNQRFQDNFANCLRLAKTLARKLYREQVVPQIDLGDPPPPWVERQLAAISVELRDEQREAEFLAHFVGGTDPALAAHLLSLARALTA